MALDDDEIGYGVRLAHLDVGLVFRRVVTGDRGLVVREFNHDVAGAAGAFDGGELPPADGEAAPPFLEDRTVGDGVGLVALVIAHIDASDPVTLCHCSSPS